MRITIPSYRRASVARIHTLRQWPAPVPAEVVVWIAEAARYGAVVSNLSLDGTVTVTTLPETVTDLVGTGIGGRLRIG